MNSSHVVDVVVQVEFAFLQRHEAGVLPVGDVDLVVLEHGAHRVAQQRGVVAGQRRNDQHGRLALEPRQRGGIVGEALEAAQLAERLVDFDPLVDGHRRSVDIDGSDAELGLLVVLPQAVHHVVAGRYPLGERVLAERRQWIAVQLGCRLGEVRERFHHGPLGFVDLVKHLDRPFVALQYSICNMQQVTGETTMREGHLKPVSSAS